MDYVENIDNSDFIAKLPLKSSNPINNDFLKKIVKIETAGKFVTTKINNSSKDGTSFNFSMFKTKDSLQAFGNPILLNINMNDPENPTIEFLLNKNAKRDNEGKLLCTISDFIDCLNDDEKNVDVQLKIVFEKDII